MKKITPKKQSSELDKLYSEMITPKTFSKGDIVEGTVVDIKSAEIAIDIGGRTEGVVYGKEMKLEGEKFTKKVGDKILAFVVYPENTEGQIELSIRKTGAARKWHELAQAKEANESIFVTVVEANAGGVLVEIGGGLRGFVPSSHLDNSRIYTDTIEYDDKKDATKKVQSKLVKLIGEELEVKVMEIIEDQSRIILSEKMVNSEADVEQRKETLSTLKVGDVLEGKVTGIAPFGLFVNAGGLEGLVHLSEISWDKVTNPGDFYKIEDEVKVQVIGLSDGGKKVAYSIKRLIPDPWKQIVKSYKVGQIVKGTVTRVADYGAFVKVEDGLNGLIHISELSNKLVRNPADIVKSGENIEVMIISISDEDRHLGLSLKRLKAKEAKASVQEKENKEESSRELEGLNELLGKAENSEESVAEKE